MIRISNSKRVSLKTPLVPNLTLRNVPMLVELYMYGNWTQLQHNFPRIRCCHSQLEVLTLHAVDLEDITQLSEVARLNKLKRLVLIFGAEGNQRLVKLISFLSKACPNLEEFVLMLFWCFEPKRVNRPLRRKVKRHPVEHLKVFEMLGYYGRLSDVELIMHLMENAAALEKVIVDPHNPLNESLYVLEEQVARSIALQQFETIRESIPPHVEVVIR